MADEVAIETAEAQPASTVATFLLRSHLLGLEVLGVDVAAVCQHAGIHRSELTASCDHHPYEVSERLWAAAVHVTGDDAIGVRVAELLRPQQFDVVGYAARHSANLHQVIERLQRFGGLLGTRYSMSLQVAEERAVFVIDPVWAKPSVRHTSECFVVGLVSMARRLTGMDWPLIEARFRHGRPDDTTQLERHLGPNLRFDAPQTGMVFPSEYLKLKVLGHDPQLGKILERQACDLVERLYQSNSVTDQVRKLLVKEVSGGNSNAEHIATRLNTSVRTLSRKLSAEGTSHQALLDQVRYELASSYLTNSEVDVGDVAYLLGFADSSSFNRAFKRWSGTTPSDYRTV